ncbi:MAG: hypothetical protein M0017_12250, partial [Desulfobacteraceae bacterium]|nr:hypothetical protein [Desulfobacteraceae bacterium]
TKINVAPDGRHVEVVMLIEKNVRIIPQMFAQLQVVGITGIMFIEIDVTTGRQVPAPPALSFRPRYPVIPTRPSEISQLFTEVEKILAKLNKLDLAGISARMQATLENFDHTATSVRTAMDHLQIEEGVASFRKAMAQTQKDLDLAGTLLAKVNGTIDRQQPQLQEALAHFKTAMANLDRLTRETAGIAAGAGNDLVQLHRQMQEIGANLEQATDNLSRAAEEFANQPSQLLREPPPPRELPK